LRPYSGPININGLEVADNKNDSTFTSFQNNILAADYNRVQNTSHYHKPRGSFVIDAIFVAPNDAAAVQGTKNPLASYAAGTNSIYVEFTTTEPLFLSPFLQGISSCEDHSGIFGVNALNFTINFMGGTGASRAWRSARLVGGGTAQAPNFQTKTATLINVANAEMYLKFYTPKQTLLSNPRCVVPYYEWQIFKVVRQHPSSPPSRATLQTNERTDGL
jgi:hypothetical protein